jgi:hypothetical protein
MVYGYLPTWRRQYLVDEPMAIRKHSAHVLSLRGPAASSSPVSDIVSGYATAIDGPIPALSWMCVVT